MAVLQNTFPDDIPEGFPGMEANGEASNIISRTLESANCGFGKAVFRGADDQGCVTTPSAALYGITLANRGLPVTTARAADTYITGDTIRIKNSGTSWVLAGDDVTDGAAVYVTSGGAFTDTSGGNTALVGWVFDQTKSSGDVVRIVRR
ncbi:structural cement protein Gp24 [Sphingosinicella xenopeptidilytica]|uniref:Bacteriophage protein n=1 Tax=Sphingosinicella xenopeptidilytica TaxID=364098 RepID=A0ABW3C189_SPHXN